MRDTPLPFASDPGSPERPGLPSPKPEVSPRNTLNGLTAKEWLSESVSVWTQRGLGASHRDAAIEKLHPAPFSFQDVARVIKLLTKPSATVLDPFSGVGSTLKACALEGRSGIGFELYPNFVELTKKRLEIEVPSEVNTLPQEIRQGDIRQLAKALPEESVDLIVTSPPYWGILNKKADHKVTTERLDKGLSTNYGDDPRDLGNIESYDEFITSLGDALGACIPALKPKAHMVLIVGDFRHKSRYFPFHADISRDLEARGLTLQAMNILYQRHKRVFPYGYPYAYVPNVHHQNIVILRKNAR